MDFKKVNDDLYEMIDEEFRDFILKRKHPCVIAKTLFLLDNYHLKVYNSIEEQETLRILMDDLESYINQYDFESNEFESLIAVFPFNRYKTELEFERALWKTLQKLHELDDCEWDETVSDNPENSNFSFSLNGRAFYIVGLHPQSSRLARKSPYTTIVFNLHWQFERLREMKAYKKVKKRTRKRDKKLQGYINPVLKDFGKESEAKQYSGRQVEDNWKCPFQHKAELV